MRKGSCFYCGYLKEIKLPNGGTRYYCSDKDCTVDPNDPDCNYDDQL